MPSDWDRRNSRERDLQKFLTAQKPVNDSPRMAARGGGRVGRGRGRGGSRTSFLGSIAQQMDTTPNKLWKRDVGYEPDPTFPNLVLL